MRSVPLRAPLSAEETEALDNQYLDQLALLEEAGGGGTQLALARLMLVRHEKAMQLQIGAWAGVWLGGKGGARHGGGRAGPSVGKNVWDMDVCCRQRPGGLGLGLHTRVVLPPLFARPAGITATCPYAPTHVPFGCSSPSPPPPAPPPLSPFLPPPPPPLPAPNPPGALLTNAIKEREERVRAFALRVRAAASRLAGGQTMARRFRTEVGWCVWQPRGVLSISISTGRGGRES